MSVNKKPAVLNFIALGLPENSISGLISLVVPRHAGAVCLRGLPGVCFRRPAVYCTAFASRQMILTLKQGRRHQPWYGCIEKSHGPIGVCEYTRLFSRPCPPLGRPRRTTEPLPLVISIITLPPPPLPAATWFLLEGTALGLDLPSPPPPVPSARAAVA